MNPPTVEQQIEHRPGPWESVCDSYRPISAPRGEHFLRVKRFSRAPFVAVVAAGVAWVARGIYDETQMGKGVFQVVNADATQRTNELIFPSDDRRSAMLGAVQAVNFYVANTEKGAVSVMNDGKVVDSAG